MGKYCKEYGLTVTYLDCMGCKACFVKRSKFDMSMRYLVLEPEQEVFCVYSSEREGETNRVIKCKVTCCHVFENNTVYDLEPIKAVLGKKDTSDINTVLLMCSNATINTGLRDKPNRFPVFTTKERCLEWLRK